MNKVPSSIVDGTPLLLGRLKAPTNGHAALTGHTGDVQAVPSSWYEPVRRMDGFHAFADISRETGVPAVEVRAMFDALRGDKRVGFLEEWNRTSWCPRCRVYLSRAVTCPSCAGAAAPVPLLPPCDPWILFGEEYRFVAELLKAEAGLTIPDDGLLLGNNGVRDGTFFWQIVYDGDVVLTVDFRGHDRASWRATVTEHARRADWRRAAAPRDDEIRRTADVNRPALAGLEADSIAFLEEVTHFYPTRPLLYFSGGKESVVMLRLLEKAQMAANLAFVGTGLDFPEDAAFLLEELKPLIDAHPLFHLEVNVAPPEKFIGLLREHGGLDARRAWCRTYVKVPLKREITDRLYGDQHFVALEGSRWYENDFRRSHPRVNFATGYDKQIWVHPLAEWTGLDVWLYIYAEQLKVNPMYARGYQRTTCWMCPIVNPFHLETSKRQYPELWRQIAGVRLQGFDGGDNLNTPF